ncbi:DUF342 domain-containing protein [Sporosarcina siberiensis]|uniref:DUF342 domain-containing protein n=1 Tax=Sporosarcina siberiensis TaxID=1365606 RepID=A0ABW4SAZ0_9BACL
MLTENEFFKLYVKDKEVLLVTKKNGFPLKSFDTITRDFPRLKINSFQSLRSALNALGEENVIGSWLPLIDIEISKNNMEVQIIIHATTKELNEDFNTILLEADRVLHKAGVIFGKVDWTTKKISSGVPIIAAVGIEPEKGANAIITYIDPPERKPVIREDGSANLYEMNFVFPINEGDWLGEKLLPQEGIDGMDVFGNVVKATRGNDDIIRYDRKSIIEDKEADKVIIRAAHGGALEYQDGIVSVGKHLKINGDVGPETGAINFDGAITIIGTVLAGYTVTATGDISIEGNEGVTNAKLIQSSEGDVFVKGGVFGGGTMIVEAQGAIFIKHANNCKIYAKEVHVGLYLFGSEIIADHVFVDKYKGKIIGGKIEALYSIETAIVGNNHERTTILHAQGIDKDALYKEIQVMAQDLKERQQFIGKLEGPLASYEEIQGDLSADQKEAYVKMHATVDANREQMLILDKEIQILLNEIKSAVAAKIEVTLEAHPGTIIQIGKSSAVLHTQTKGVFKMVDGVLNV